MARVLVTERIASAGLDVLQDAGHTVEVRLGLSPEELLSAVGDTQALIIRSATQITAPVLEAGRDLVVVGRAGVGLDNVDLAAATRLGVTVVNAPLSNVLSAAEHTVALILAQARNIPQAHAALVAGRWERAKWEGIELSGKTLGIVGLGRVGRLVAERVAGFAMLTLAYDPYISAEQARELRIELVSLPELMALSDFVSLHVARTPETIGLIGAELLASAKPGIRIVNVARGGLVDEEALAEALRTGRVGGAALDVFDGEPIESSPLFGMPGVVVTPHLGASTAEAQHRAGVNIAEQVNGALAGEFVPFAVNVEARHAADILRPFLPLCEHMGGMLAINVRPSRHMVMITNEDRPGVVGAVGTILGEAGVNIHDMVLDRSGTASGTSLIVLSTDRHVEADVAQQLRDAPGVLTVNVVRLGTVDDS